MDSACRIQIHPQIEGSRLVFPPGTEPHPGHRLELRQPYLFSPQLAHLLGGRLARLTGGFSLRKARAISAAWIALAAAAVFLAASSLWPGRMGAAWLAGLSFGLWPQVTFLGAYVNDDAFALLAVGLLLLACARVERAGPTWGGGAVLGVAIGLVGLSKVYAYAAFPPLVLWMVRGCVLRGRATAARFLLSGAIACAVVGAWIEFDRAALLGGAPDARARAAALRDFIAALPPPLLRQTHLLEAGSLSETGHPLLDFPLRAWLLVSLLSGFGAFGWMDAPLPLAVYLLSAVVLSAAMSGLLPFFRSRRPPALRLPVVFSWPLLAVAALFSIGYSYSVDYQPQGRYLLPAVPSLMILAVAGATSLPALLGRWGPSILAAYMLAVNLYSRLFVLR